MSATIEDAAKAIVEAVHEVHKAFGAPGDHGYETREGRALFALYKAGNELQHQINVRAEPAPATTAEG